jgi:DNA-binding NarL/FixJ family response regulator
MNRPNGLKRSQGNPQGKARIIVVVDHPVTRLGISALIGRERDLVVCGEAASASAAAELIPRLAPDLAIVDLAHGTMGGIEAVRDFKVLRPQLRVLVMSMQDEDIFAERALRAGAAGYIMKRRPVGDVMTAVRALLGGEIYLSETMRETILRRLVRNPKEEGSSIDALTDREMEVFRLIGKGYRTQLIAETLHLSPKTVDTHREHLKRKLEVGSADDLVRHAIQWAKSTNID